MVERTHLKSIENRKVEMSSTEIGWTNDTEQLSWLVGSS